MQLTAKKSDDLTQTHKQLPLDLFLQPLKIEFVIYLFIF